MGMTVASGSGMTAEPNVVPLIDVLLVLIIIFMVIAPKVPTGLPTAIPQQPEDKIQIPDLRVVVVQVLPENQLKINDENTDWNRLGPRLFEIFKQRADKVAFVKGGSEVPFAEIARAIDVMRGAGIEQVGLVSATQ